MSRGMGLSHDANLGVLFALGDLYRREYAAQTRDPETPGDDMAYTLTAASELGMRLETILEWERVAVLQMEVGMS